MADLDDTILGRIASMKEIERPSSLPRLSPDTRDRFVIQHIDKRIVTNTIGGWEGGASDVPAPAIVGAEFGELENAPIRTLTVQAFERRQNPGDPLVPVTVVYSASADHVQQLLRRLVISLFLFGLLAAVATAAVARSVARVTMRPLRDTADIIGAIDEKSLNRRIDLKRLPAELTPMARRLNDMLGRLESAFNLHRQFLADASHELRTPVAGLVTTLEVALRRPREAADYQRVLETCITDAHQLQQLVVALMDQVRSQRYAAELDIVPLPATTMLRQCGQLARTLGGAKNMTVNETIPENLMILSDEQKLRSIVTNLLSNAVEYTHSGGTIWLSAELLAAGAEHLAWPAALSAAVPKEMGGVETAARRIVIRVRDNGPGIASQHLPNLFEPFYRADRARTDGTNHLGLGLSIVRANVRCFGKGEIAVAKARLNRGRPAAYSQSSCRQLK